MEQHETPGFESNEIKSIEIEEALSKLKKAANWFYWIAGLSLINSILNLANNDPISFLAGLGITQMVDGIIYGFYGKYHYTAVLVNLVIAGGFAFFGWKANQANKTALIIGLNLYALDAALFLIYGDWKGLIFHGLVFYFIFQGIAQINHYKALTAPKS